MRLEDQINKSTIVFIEAVKEGNTLIVDSLLDNLLTHVAMTNIVDPTYAGNPIHWAANNGHLNILKKLITKCPEAVNSTTLNGSTPLLNAITNDHYSETIYLLQNNANPTQVNNNSESGFSAALKKEDNHPIKIYMQDYRELLNKNFKDALLKNDWKQAEEFLNKGADIETPIKDIDTKARYTALFHACCIGNAEMVKKLILLKANVNVIGAKNGFSALHAAANFGYVDIVNLLLDASANSLVKDLTGNTPLDIAKTRQIPQLISSLEAKTPKEIPSNIRPQAPKLNEVNHNYASFFMPPITKPTPSLEERFSNLKGSYYLEANIKNKAAEKPVKRITLEEIREKITLLSNYAALIEEAGTRCIKAFNSKCTLPTQQEMKVDLLKFRIYVTSVRDSIHLLNECFSHEDIREITDTITKNYKIETICSKIANATSNVHTLLDLKILPSQEYYQDYSKLFDGMRVLEDKASHLRTQVGKINDHKLMLTEPTDSSLAYN